MRQLQLTTRDAAHYSRRENLRRRELGVAASPRVRYALGRHPRRCVGSDLRGSRGGAELKMDLRKETVFGEDPLYYADKRRLRHLSCDVMEHEVIKIED